jgi:Zinc-binding dehydrogenase
MEPVACIPDGVADDQGAALPIPAVTALRAVDLLEVTAGRHLMVMGAAGGVGGYAVQMARCRGAHVIATVRGDAGEARRLGAKEVYDSRGAGVIDALRAAHPDGVDAILDLVSGPETIPRDAEVIRPGGRLVSTIHAADEGWFAQRQITAYNHASSANPLISPEGLTTVAQMLTNGTITAHPGRSRPGRRRTGAGRTPPRRPARQGRHPPVEPGPSPARDDPSRPASGSLAENPPCGAPGWHRAHARPRAGPRPQPVLRDPIVDRELDRIQNMAQELGVTRILPADSGGDLVSARLRSR